MRALLVVAAMPATLLIHAVAFAQEPPLAPLPPASEPPSSRFVAPPPPPVAVPIPMAQAVLVHVNADRPVLLQLLAMDATRWTPVCTSPCDASVPLGGVYRVVAPGIQASREVELEAASGDRVVLDVNVRSNEEHTTAQRLVIAGYVAGAAGLGLEVGAIAVTDSSAAQALLWAGVGAAAAGITFAITAYVMGQPTGISQSRAAGAVPAMPSQAGVFPFPSIADARLPVWRVDSEALIAPQATNVPVVTWKF